ncbi:hypothetical protein HN51_048406 [Arachis hypogaea]
MTRVIVLVLREQLAELTEQVAELGAGCGKERPEAHRRLEEVGDQEAPQRATRRTAVTHHRSPHHTVVADACEFADSRPTLMILTPAAASSSPSIVRFTMNSAPNWQWGTHPITQYRTLYTWINEKGASIGQRTYAEQHLNASCIAHKLLTSQKPVIKLWDKVLVVYVPGLDFIDAFFECLRARAIPVLVLPPDPMQRSGQALTKMENIAKSCSIMAILSTVAYHSAVRQVY